LNTNVKQIEIFPESEINIMVERGYDQIFKVEFAKL